MIEQDQKREAEMLKLRTDEEKAVAAWYSSWVINNYLVKENQILAQELRERPNKDFKTF